MAVLVWIIYRSRAPGHSADRISRDVPAGGAAAGVRAGADDGPGSIIPIPIYGTLWLMALAYFTVLMPLGVRTLAGVVLQIDKSLEECARVCGASWVYQMRTVTLPLLRPGIIAAWLLVFIASVRELGVSIFLVGRNAKVIAPSIIERLAQFVLDRLSAALALDPDRRGVRRAVRHAAGGAALFGRIAVSPAGVNPARGENAAIEIADLVVRYGEAPAVNGVSFTVAQRRARDPARARRAAARPRPCARSPGSNSPPAAASASTARPSIPRRRGATCRPRSAACRWCSSPMRCGRI